MGCDENMDKIIFVYFAVIISCIDIKTYRIPDSILVMYLLLKTCADIRVGNVFMQLEQCMSGIMAFLIFYLVYRCSKGLGYGDVKYAAVIGYAVGIRFFFLGAFIASVMGIIVFIIGSRMLKWDIKGKLPFAPFLSVGVIMALIF